MALFGREPEAPQTPRTPTAPTPTTPVAPAVTPGAGAPAAAPSSTQIGRGGRVKGEISGPISVVVEGEFEGVLSPDQDVRIGKAGIVVGEIHARVITVGGKVRGDVKARERVEILPTGSLEGDITAPQMAIADGAYFKGKVEMTGGSDDGSGSRT